MARRMGRTATETPARLPDQSGYVERDGVRIWWEAYGSDDAAILLMPTWSIVHSRHWKAQIHYLARHFRVVTLDGRGTGTRTAHWARVRHTQMPRSSPTPTVLDAAGVVHTVVVGLSRGGRYALELAAAHRDRVLGVVAIAPSLPSLTPRHPWRAEV